MVLLLALIFKGLLIIGGIALVISVLLTILTFILGIIKTLFFGISVGDQTFNLPLRLKMMGVKKALNSNDSPRIQNPSNKNNPIVTLFWLVLTCFCFTSIPAFIVLFLGVLFLPFSIVGSIISDNPFFLNCLIIL